MALEKENKIISYQDRIGVNSGSGYASLAEASNREANNFDVIGNALSSKLLNVGQQIGQKTGSTAAQNYNIKRGTRTVTDANGIETEIDIVEPITTPKGLRTASQIEAFDAIMVKRYTKEVFSTLEVEAKKIYNDVKRNNGTAKDFESLAVPMFNAINENIPTNIQQAATDYSDNLLMSFGADIDAIYKDRQFTADSKEFVKDADVTLDILTEKFKTENFVDTTDFLEDLDLGVQANLIRPDDAQVYKDAIKNEKLFSSVVRPVLTDGSIQEQSQVLKELQIIFGGESTQTSGTFVLSNGKQIKINKQDLLNQGITQNFLDKKVTSYSKLSIDIDNANASGGIDKITYGPNGNYAQDNPNATSLQIISDGIANGYINPNVKRQFDNIAKDGNSYINFIGTEEYKILKDSAKTVDGVVLTTNYIDNLDLNQASINAFNELENIRLGSNVSPSEAHRMFVEIKKNTGNLPQILEKMEIDESILRETISKKVGVKSKAKFNTLILSSDSASAYMLDNLVYKTIENELLAGNLQSLDNLENRIESIVELQTGKNGNFGSDEYTGDIMSNSADKVISIHPVKMFAGIDKTEIITSFVSGVETQVDIETESNNVDYLKEPVMTMVFNSGEVQDQNGTLGLIKDKLVWGDNIKLTSISTIGATKPMYQIIYIAPDGDTTGLTYEKTGLPLIINPFGSDSSVGVSLYQEAIEKNLKIQNDWKDSAMAGTDKYYQDKKEIKIAKQIQNRLTIEELKKEYKARGKMTQQEFEFIRSITNSTFITFGDAIKARFDFFESLDIAGDTDLSTSDEYNYHVNKILPYGFVYVEEE